MTTEAKETLQSSHKRWGRLHLTVSAIANYRRLSAAKVGADLGMSRETTRSRLAGETDIKPWEADAFAVVLDVPRDVLDLPPREALIWIIQNEPDLDPESDIRWQRLLEEAPDSVKDAAKQAVRTPTCASSAA